MTSPIGSCQHSCYGILHNLKFLSMSSQRQPHVQCFTNTKSRGDQGMNYHVLAEGDDGHS